MLHELLLALSGYHGSIFVLNKDGHIQVASGLPFLHDTEAAMLNRICKLATHYTRFVGFIQKYTHIPGGGVGEKLYGLYMRAFCQGLDLVLNPYREKLLGLEKELLSDPHLTAAYVQSQLDDYQLLFVSLSSVIDQLEQHRVHGCNILEVLHRASSSGTPIVTAAILRIQHVCHGVLFKQISAWMLHGMLLDKYGELFIQKTEKAAQTDDPSEHDADDIGLGGFSGKFLKQMLISEGDEFYKQEEFCLHAEMLPSYIPARVAEKILFVGQSVQMFESEKGKQHRHKTSILRGKEDEFAKELHHLSQETEFNLLNFEAVIDRIRTYVAEQLWKLVVEESDLLGQLRILKDFYLLGRGELYLAFIDQAQVLLRLPPVATTQHDVNAALQQAARNVLFDDEGLMQKFKFLVEYDASKGKKIGSQSEVTQQQESGWSALSLEYSVEWPIHILLTTGVMLRYNSLFVFLLHVKRVQLELQQCWALQMHRKRLNITDAHAPKWWLRNHMAFLLDNLQYYLQVDVIESQFKILLDKIDSTRDFEAIRLAHDNFLTALLSQSFLLMKPVNKCLCEILDMCHRFSLIVSNSEIVLTDTENAQLEEIAKEFQKQSNLLFMILSSVRSHQSSPHLAQLLLRIDYNKYFTQAGGKLGSYEAAVPDDLPAPSSRRR